MVVWHAGRRRRRQERRVVPFVGHAWRLGEGVERVGRLGKEGMHVAAQKAGMSCHVPQVGNVQTQNNVLGELGEGQGGSKKAACVCSNIYKRTGVTRRVGTHPGSVQCVSIENMSPQQVGR